MALRRVRGSWLDPFGYTRQRRHERDQASWYRELLAALTRTLTPAGHPRALRLAQSAGAIPGYEQIRLDRETAVRGEIERALEELGSQQS